MQFDEDASQHRSAALRPSKCTQALWLDYIRAAALEFEVWILRGSDVN